MQNTWNDMAHVSLYQERKMQMAHGKMILHMEPVCAASSMVSYSQSCPLHTTQKLYVALLSNAVLMGLQKPLSSALKSQ